MTQSRITIFDHTGTALTDVRAYAESSWPLNEYGSTSFELSRQDLKATAEFLNGYNVVLVQREHLPAWAGLIVRRGWNEIKISCKSAEWWLFKRRLTQAVKMTAPAGVIFKRLIDEANARPTIIQAGEIYEGGKAVKLEYSAGTLVYDAVVQLSQKSGQDWNVTPARSTANRLYLLANWYQQLGVTRQYPLIENRNLQLLSNQFDEDFENIQNDVLAVGSGATADSRNIQPLADAASADQYGWLQSGAVNFTASELGTVAEQGEVYLKAAKDKRVSLPLNVLPVTNSYGFSWDFVRTGDILPVTMRSVGFTGGHFGYKGNFRILSMAVKDHQGVLECAAEEVLA